ncbi:hypothetical protein [Baekduia soli]|uniref:hypothetical protein n=1 Tax=Baekduia soli TaxID=496014 RepID=UPI001652A6A6|nr:hypothetical protein [Baekduia soli]
MTAAHPHPEVAPPAAPPRPAGWRDRLRTRRATRRGVTVQGTIVLGRGVRFAVGPGARIVLGAGCALGDGCRLQAGPGATVVVGAGTRLGDRCVLSAHERVTLGTGCLLADEVVLTDADRRFDDPERPCASRAWSPRR